MACLIKLLVRDIFFLLSFTAVIAQSIPGVHTPFPINPTVEITDNQWLLDLYRVVLNREHDAGGYITNYMDLQKGLSRQDMYNSFTSSAEFTPSLKDRSGFIIRCYKNFLLRTPSQQEIDSQLTNLKNFDGSGTGQTWLDCINSFYYSQEYKTHCQTSYYSLGAQVNMSALLMRDLFNGNARLQQANESQNIQLNVPTAKTLWDNKIPMLVDPSGGYFGFTRAFLGGNLFTIVLLHSNDGISFTEIGPIFDPAGDKQTYYDAHIAIDNSVCPIRYVMSMECIGNEGAASLCTSQSTTPGLPETWSKPFVVVDGCTGNPAGGVCGTTAAESASTGVSLIDGSARYAAWTQVYDGQHPPNDPLAHTYSQSSSVSSFSTYFGSVLKGKANINTMMSSEPFPAGTGKFCTDAWDCNNRDKQDWKREGDYYYAIYNGANSYRCDGTWGISIARSTTASGPEYTDRLPLSRGISSVVSGTCGISYPYLNVINGELYFYYAFIDKTGRNSPWRSKIIKV